MRWVRPVPPRRPLRPRHAPPTVASTGAGAGVGTGHGGGEGAGKEGAGKDGAVRPARTSGRLARRLATVVALVAASAATGGLVVAVDRARPPDLSRLVPSTQVLAADETLLRAFLTESGAWRLPADPATVDPRYLRGLLAIEDQRFGRHPGVDPLAVLRAIAQAVARGRIVSGASTLAMQTARLLTPRPHRSLGAKVIEAVRALQLDARLGKDGILRAYLTLAPYGGNLEGVRAGSLAWFGKEPQHLAPAELALLIALPQAPEALRPDRHPKAARAARNRILARLIAAGVLSTREGTEAMADPVPQTRRPMPLQAPHLARLLAAQAPPGSRLITTLDADLQRRLEDLARRRVNSLGPRRSLAVLAAESATGRVRAVVGAPDLLDASRQGAVDMTRAIRSPGSALKPLIYGMAFEQHLIHPATLMRDAPTRFGSYSPSNFQDVHRGEVTAREALVQSLNVPAVALLDRIGPLAFAHRLEDAGVAYRLPRGVARPGLPLALGGVGVTLADLVGLYAAIDAGGSAPPLWALAPPASEVGSGDASPPPSAPAPPRRVLSPAAAWQVADILADSPPPPGYAAPARRSGTGGLRHPAYKTGTSYGFRDAWAIGFDGATTIGVWVGRPDGTPSPDAIGRDTAAPILFEAFEHLDGPPPPARRPPPPGVVLADTADLPPPLQRFGPHTAGLASAGASPGAAGRLRDPDAPSLTFPPDGATLDPASLGPGGLGLAARGGQRPLTWLVNGRPLATPAHVRQTHWSPPGSGRVTVTVVDALGRSDHATVWIGR